MRGMAIAVLIWLCAAGLGLAAEEWRQVSEGIADLRGVALGQDDGKTLYISSGRRIYKSDDNGASWRILASLKADINFLLTDRELLFAATQDGLFRSDNKGEGWSWGKSFRGRDELERVCGSLALTGDKLYLSTASAIFLSTDKGDSWQKVEGVFPDAIRNGEAVFESADQPALRPRALAFDAQDPAHIYFGDYNGVQESRDNGASWKALAEYGLLERRVAALEYFRGRGLCAVTCAGIFAFRQGRWRELSLELAAGRVYNLAEDGSGNLYAATDKGLYLLGPATQSQGAPGNELPDTRAEPDIASLQQAAVEYAEVSPDKIRKWRKLAAKKALLPKVSVGMNNNTSDVWHWETGSTTRNDDDILRRGKGTVEWDFSLSWDLSDLIWSEAQTSIDTRSKLMVELREDVLHRVNKYYFERQRVKAELENLQPQERKKRLDRQIRLRELTASLDALTGGYFSKHLAI